MPSSQAAVQAAAPTAQAPVQPFVLLMDVRASAPNIRLPRNSGAAKAGGFRQSAVACMQPLRARLSNMLQTSHALLEQMEQAIACPRLLCLPVCKPASASCCPCRVPAADSMDAIEADLGQLTLQTAGIVPQVRFVAALAEYIICKQRPNSASSHVANSSGSL